MKQKSIYITTCGRCGTHWVKYIISDVLGFQIELPNVRDYSLIGRAKKYIKLIEKQEKEDPGGRIYVYHIVPDRLKMIKNFVNIFCIVRDPRDVLISSSYFSIRKGKISTDMIDEYIHKRISRTRMKFTMLMESYLKNDLFFLRYEDMKQDPHFQISKILNHFGYQYDEDSLQLAIQRRDFLHMSKGRNVGEEDVFSHFRKGVTGDWKNYFSKEENESFIEKYHSIMEGFGYL